MAVGSIPPGTPIMVRELHQIREDRIKWGGGLFCAKFCYVQGAFTPCLKAWCGTCYQPHNLERFPTGGLVDEGEEDFGEVAEVDKIRLPEERDRDNLIRSPL